MSFEEYPNYDGLGLAELIQKKEVTASECLEAAWDRVEKYNPKINALIYPMIEQAKQKLSGKSLPDGPFHGVPFLLKDLSMSTQNEPTSYGSRWLKNYKPPLQSELLKRYQKSGLLIFGKTNTPEFGLDPVTESSLWGACRNPWDLTKTPGGSSGGSAAAITARFCPLAHASDGAGSIRIPAACCGLFGFKPTRGRIPSGPDGGKMWLGLATAHVLSRTVRDSAAALLYSSGDDLGNPFPLEGISPNLLEEIKRPAKNLRIALVKKPFFDTEIDPECLNACDQTAKLCESLGHRVEHFELDLDREELTLALLYLVAGEVSTDIKLLSKAYPGTYDKRKLEYTTRFSKLLGGLFTASDFSWTSRIFDKLTRKLAVVLNEFDMILTPSLASPPLKIGALALKPWQKKIIPILEALPLNRKIIQPLALKALSEKLSFTPYTALFNITGQPAMSIPSGMSKAGLPLGSQFAAAHQQETKLLKLAYSLEQESLWQEVNNKSAKLEFFKN